MIYMGSWELSRCHREEVSWNLAKVKAKGRAKVKEARAKESFGQFLLVTPRAIGLARILTVSPIPNAASAHYLTKLSCALI